MTLLPPSLYAQSSRQLRPGGDQRGRKARTLAARSPAEAFVNGRRAQIEGENFHEDGSDRGASKSVTELRDRQVSGEPRESPSRGSFFWGQWRQGSTGDRGG